MSEIINKDNVKNALDKGLLVVHADNSVLGETQYVLALPYHPASDMIDAFSREVFIGSIPGAEITSHIIYEYYNGRNYNDEILNYLVSKIDSNQVFSKLLSEDLKMETSSELSEDKDTFDGRCIPF